MPDVRKGLILLSSSKRKKEFFFLGAREIEWMKAWRKKRKRSQRNGTQFVAVGVF